MEHLDYILKLGTIFAGGAGGLLWVVKRIERGQRRTLKNLKNALKNKVSKDECRMIRSQCRARSYGFTDDH